MRQAMSITAKFKELSTKMGHLRNRASIERDGVGALRMECFGFQANMPPQLLNASSVMESRVSTKPVENVQLLTYINIVLLSLSFGAACSLQLLFCMSYLT
jgi:hypothetical protein